MICDVCGVCGVCGSSSHTPKPLLSLNTYAHTLSPVFHMYIPHIVSVGTGARWSGCTVGGGFCTLNSS